VNRSEWTKEFWKKLKANPKAYAEFTAKKIAAIKAGFLKQRMNGRFSGKPRPK
jgi:hypothetical protein